MTLSPYRRAKSRRAEPMQQIIAFRILQEWFALPIRAAYKVIPIGQVYGTHQGGVGLTRYRERDVIVIDIQRRIFGDFANSPLLTATASPATSGHTPTNGASTDHAPPDQRHLLLIQSSQGELIGLPLDNFPCLRRVPESAFAPIPPMYLAEGRIRCVSAIITTANSDDPPAFLLNLRQLIENPTVLPAAPEQS